MAIANQYIAAAAEFHVLCMLNRLQIDASLTFGNTKKVDIIIQNGKRTLTIDSKGANTNLQAMLGGKIHSDDPDHFYAIVHFRNKSFSDLTMTPDVYIIPASEIVKYSYKPPGGAKINQLHPTKANRKELEDRYKNAWHLLIAKSE